jgi:hypothetical protein
MVLNPYKPPEPSIHEGGKIPSPEGGVQKRGRSTLPEKGNGVEPRSHGDTEKNAAGGT